jgi:AcrR family transcriptional regulator
MARKPAPPGVDRRQQILEAALDVFAEEGFEGATTKEIAKRADVTQGLIYFYFPSKEDLFCAAFEHQAGVAFAQLNFARERESDEAPEVVLRRRIARFIAVMESPRSINFLCIMRRMEVYPGPSNPCGYENARSYIRALAAGIFKDMRAYFETRIARGVFRPVSAALASQLFISAMITTLVRRASGDEDLTRLSHAELADMMASLFLHGLLPAGASSACDANRDAAAAPTAPAVV